MLEQVHRSLSHLLTAQLVFYVAALILAYVVRAAVPRANTAAWLFMLFAVVMPGLFRSGVFVRVGTYDEIKN